MDWEEERDHYVYLLSLPENKWEVRSWFDENGAPFESALKVGDKVVLVCKRRSTRRVHHDDYLYVQSGVPRRPASPRMAKALMNQEGSVWALELNMTITLMLFKGINNVRGSFWINTPWMHKEEFKQDQCLTSLLCMHQELLMENKIKVVVPTSPLPEYAHFSNDPLQPSAGVGETV